MHEESDKEGTSSLSSFEQITPDEVSDVKRADFPKQKPWVPKKDIANLEDAQKPLLCTNASNGNNELLFFFRLKSNFINDKLYCQI